MSSPRNNQYTQNNNISNVNLLQELSKDEEYFKNHRLYEEISSAHAEAMGPIMAVANNLIALGSQEDIYRD